MLILAGEIVFADGPPDAVEHLQRLAIGVQRLTLPPAEATRSPDRFAPVLLVALRDRRETEHLPPLQAEDVADEVVLMEPLHNQEDGAGALVVEPAVEGVDEPLVAGLPLRLGERLFGLQRIIDRDDVGAASGQHSTGRGGEPIALASGDELPHGLAVGGETGQEDPSIPRGHHDAAAIAASLSARSWA